MINKEFFPVHPITTAKRRGITDGLPHTVGGQDVQKQKTTQWGRYLIQLNKLYGNDMKKIVISGEL